MMKKLMILICPVLFLNCKGQETPGVEKISASDLASAMQKDIQLVDVRTAPEYTDGHLPGAVNIDYLSKQFKSNFGALDKEKPVYIYCRSGQRSASAAVEMREMGFMKIYDLKGGIGSWDGELAR